MEIRRLMMRKMTQAVVFAMIAALGVSANSNTASACSHDGNDGFLPRNNMYIPVRRVVLDRHGNPVGGGITETEFEGVIAAVEKLYAPIVKSMGGNLVIHRRWKDGTVNAYADRNDGNWNVTMFGGLARHKETTIDGFLLVVCHELGHQIGGSPKYPSHGGDEWAANEGQSDYWATLKCARRVLQNQPNLREIRALEAPDSVRVSCRNSFTNPNEAALCVRTSMAGLALARLLAGAKSEDKMPSFNTPDRSQVRETQNGHPEAQCRLDTYLQGSVCGIDFHKDTDQKNPLINTCTQENRDPIGYRPRCWYKPGSESNIAKGNPPSHARIRGRYY